MAIDTVILKASYDLMRMESALDYSVKKYADDVRKNRKLRTIKMTRFLDLQGRDFLKFNFPVCGNLSSADLMLIYAARNGFNVYVVGNEERSKRDKLIVDTLGLKNVTSVPELGFMVTQDTAERARKELCFVNTQRRGFAALPNHGDGKLVMEMAADQPLLYDTFRHARDLDHDADIALNLNAVTLMKSHVPSFVRNGYDKVINSRGEEVVIKENNNFAQNYISMCENVHVFKMIYARRNGGGYLNIPHLITQLDAKGLFGRIASGLARIHEFIPQLPAFIRYFRGRKNLEHAATYEMLNTLLNTAISPKIFKDRAHVDATNDDVFSCWDMDGLNNDYLGYHALFERNFPDLKKIMPYAEDVYAVHDAIERRGKDLGIMRELEFTSAYAWLSDQVTRRVSDSEYLSFMKFDDKTIADVQGSGIADALFGKAPSEADMVEDLERHLNQFYLPEFEKSRAMYESAKLK